MSIASDILLLETLNTNIDYKTALRMLSEMAQIRAMWKADPFLQWDSVMCDFERRIPYFPTQYNKDLLTKL